MNMKTKDAKAVAFETSALIPNKNEKLFRSRLPSTWQKTSNSTSSTTKRRRTTQRRIQRDDVHRRILYNNMHPHGEKSRTPNRTLKKSLRILKSDSSSNRRGVLPIIYEGEKLFFSSTREAKPHIIFSDREVLKKILQFVEKKRTFEEDFHSRMILRPNHSKNRSQVEQEVQVSKKKFLYNCLMVNKIWYSVTSGILLKEIYFINPKNFRKFLAKYSGSCGEILNPSNFILKNFPRLTQKDLNLIESFIIPDNIKRLELYLCPYIVPPVSWISRFKSLERLILPGNKAIDDKLLTEISNHTPNLQILDLRACDNITDAGVIAVAIRCPSLTECNLGRRKNGNKITNNAMISLAIHTQVETLGMAGCQIDDLGLWNLVHLRGKFIKRLSLNNCKLLTNNSVPYLFAKNRFPNLLVLEIKNIHQIDNLRHIAQYKMWKKRFGISVWIAGCERINNLLRIEEMKLNALK